MEEDIEKYKREKIESEKVATKEKLKFWQEFTGELGKDAQEN